MRGYIAELNRGIEQHRAAISAKLHQLAYTPLRVQLHALLAALPSRQLNRPWRLVEIQGLLKGRYRKNCSLAMLADELRRLNWRRVRDWTNNGAGVRYWLPPGVTSWP